MTSLVRAGLLGMLGVVIGNTGCWRADFYAVTGEPVGDGSIGEPRVEALPGEPRADAIVCPATALSPGDSNRTLQVGSATRSYVLHVPSAYDGSKPVPLILDFHAMPGSGAGERTSSPYPAVTDPEGVIMAFPDGQAGSLGKTWNMGPCCVADVDDRGFARALVAEIQRLGCIDSSRVYAVGVLTGSGMVYDLACNAADVFAAVAPAAFDLLEETVKDCVPVRPITVLSFRGTAGSHVPYAGGPSTLVQGMPITFLGAKNTFAEWATIDGCTDSASKEDSKGCAFHSSCRNGVEVGLCTKQGGDDEPGDASIAWPILKRHSL